MSETKKVYEDNECIIYLDTYEETSYNKGVYGHRVVKKGNNNEEDEEG
jgi:hypothetical protein